MTKNILVFIDHFKGAAQLASWEALGVSRTLAGEEGKVSALILGHGVESLAEAAFQYGADEVYLADAPALEDYRPDPWADVAVQVARDTTPDVMVFPTTTRAREVAGMAAVDLAGAARGTRALLHRKPLVAGDQRDLLLRRQGPAQLDRITDLEHAVRANNFFFT